MKSAAKFSRDQRCTKVELWNCFYAGGRFDPVPVVTAKQQIGDNAPKYLVAKGFALLGDAKGVEYYTLTESGKAWLTKGVLRHIELHPEERSRLEVSLPGEVMSPRRVAIRVPRRR